MSKQELYELIERYISGEMDAEKHRIISDRIESDKEFAREVELHLELKEALGDPKIQDLSQKIKNVINEESNTKKYNSSGRGWIITIVGVLLLAALLWFGKKYFSPPSPEDLYHQFADFPIHQENIGIDQIRSEGEEKKKQTSIDSLWSMYYEAYNNGNFKNGITLLDDLFQAGENPLNISYQRGLTYAGMGDCGLAIKEFEQSVSVQDMSYWYMGLCRLKIGSKEEAINMLRLVSSSIHPRTEKATELLEELIR